MLGLFWFAERVVGIAEQAVDQRVEWIDLDGFFQHGARVLEILRRVIGAAQLNIGVDVVGIDVEGLLEQPQRFVRAVHFDHHPAELVENDGRVRADLQGALILAGGGDAAAFGEQLIGQARTVARHRRLNLAQFDDFFIFLLIFFDLEFAHPAAFDLLQPFGLEESFPTRFEGVKGKAVDFFDRLRRRLID